MTAAPEKVKMDFTGLGTGFAPSAETRIRQWRERAAAFARSLSAAETMLHNQIMSVLYSQESEEVTLVFSGHFKSGKSTTLNAALGRALLPTDPLPETGAMCILRSGSEDAARLFHGQETRVIPCTTRAIQQETSLISDAGERRTEVSEIRQLEVTLADCAIPGHARWIDSPGINDTDDMNLCARRAAGRSDVLVWVLSSRQPLSLPEVTFIGEHIQDNGPSSVVFLLNSFLDEDTELAWNQFLQHSLATIRAKVHDHGEVMGFTRETLPTVIPIASRALSRHGGDSYGGAALRALLGGLCATSHTRVIRTRMYRAGTQLARLGAHLEAQLAEEKARWEARQAQIAQRRAAQQAQQEKLKRALNAIADEYQASLPGALEAAGDAYAAALSAPTLKRDGSHGTELNARLQEACAYAMTTALAEISIALRDSGQTRLTGAQMQKCKLLLLPYEVMLDVPQNAPEPKTDRKAGAIAGGVVGFLVTGFNPLGAIAGAGIGAGTARDDGKNAALQKDVDGLKVNIGRATQNALSSARRSSGNVVNYVLEACGATLPVAETDAAKVQELEMQVRALRRLADEAHALGTGQM